jgi:oligoribonuclease (3'-5' exoribonuclease)
VPAGIVALAERDARERGEAAVFVKPTAGAHDASIDVKLSIAELSHYRQTLFRAP